MIITRKIEVFVCESDKDLRKEYYDKLHTIRDIARKAANAMVSHLFMLDNSVPYLDEETKNNIQYLGTKGTPASKQNVAYCVASNLFKDSMPGIAKMLSYLSHTVRKYYEEDKKQGMWKRSLRSYKSNLPIPYHRESFLDFGFRTYIDTEGKEREGCFFKLAGIPFQMKFGRDRSGNRIIVERVLSGEYKMCTSSIKCDGNKVFLLLCVDIPKTEVKLDEKKTLYAFLGVVNPIVCTADTATSDDYSRMKVFEIGTEEEFNHRRRQIQEAVRRCRIDSRYAKGGKGRQKKLKAVNRWHNIEANYIDTKLHTYSKMLVDTAVKCKCGEITLMSQTHREEYAKRMNIQGDNYILRNWSYYGLKEKIAYKCKRYGIKLTVEE